MKKILILSFLLVLSAGLMAQRASSTTSVPTTTTIKNLTMTTADTITQGATAYWTFDVGLRKEYYYAFQIAIDTVVHATNRLSVTVWGSLNNVDFVSSGITQVNVYPTAGGGADTTLVMANVTTPQLWRYLKVRFVSTDANVVGGRIKALGLKIAEK